MDWVVILKNNSGSNVVITDLGMEIGNGQQITLSNYFNYSEIADSSVLQNLVSTGILIINNGISDLSATDGANYIIRDNIYRDLQTHFTKEELSISGAGGVIHWDNIINTPSFGSPLWKEPVEFRVASISEDAPATPAIGYVYIDTDDNNYYKWDGTTWQNVGSADVGDRVINLDNPTENVFTFDGTTWVDGGQPLDNAAVMVNDNGFEKNSQYVYSTEEDKWIKIADVDFEKHLDGGPDKHNASEINVTGTYSQIGGPTDLESMMEEINDQMVIAIDNNTLGSAYNQGGAGAGRIILAETGAVKIDTVSATSAPFQLVPKASLPTTGLEDGQLAIRDGILCVYDAIRSSWLSVQRQFLAFGRSGNSRNQYLNFFAGNVASNNSGFRLARNATIVSLSGQLSQIGDCTLNVRRNDTATNIAVLEIATAIGNQSISTNVQVNATDHLQGFVGTVGSGVRDPLFIIEIAWRL